MVTYFRDTKDGVREAWQNGILVFKWSKLEIENMHTESPEVVKPFGYYKHDAFVDIGRSQLKLVRVPD